MEPQIISSYNGGEHNADLNRTVSRLKKDGAWKDLRTILIVPAGDDIPSRVVANWWNMITPPNQGFVRLLARGMEVGVAYSSAIESILANPDLAKWPYICTLEHDNTIPPDGVMMLQRRMEDHPEFAAISGLYHLKGPGGCAQIWGHPQEFPMNFKPQPPDPNGGLVECNGIGMGFAIWRTKIFKDERLRRPWFKTVASAAEGVGTQDLYACGDMRKHGYRFAVDCSVRVGHYDKDGKFGIPDFIW